MQQSARFAPIVLVVSLTAVSCAAPTAATPGPEGRDAPLTAESSASDRPDWTGTGTGTGTVLTMPGALDAAVDASAVSVRGAAPAAAPPADRWAFSVAPYVWLFDMDGSVAKGAKSLPVALSLHDSWDLVKDHLDFGLAGHLEARKGDWSFFLDGDLLSFQGDHSASKEILRGYGLATAEIDIDMDIALAEAGVAWRAVDVRYGNGCAFPVEILAGARWNQLDVSIDLDVTAAAPRQQFQRDYGADFNESWADPFVGLRTRIPLNEGVCLRLRGDVGGGLGEGSDVAWNVTAMLEFGISESVSAFAGWRWYDFERDAGGRDTELQLEGPGFGVEIRF